MRLWPSRAHDVGETYRLAMAEPRVRLPLGALNFRVWESLVIRVRREHETAGSNPAILTPSFAGLMIFAVGPVLVREGDC